MILAGLFFALSAGALLAGADSARADGPATNLASAPAVMAPSTTEPAAPSEGAKIPADPARVATPPIVIGFVGGFLRHDDAVHSTVILARNLQRDYAGVAHVETFENRRVNDARATVLSLLAQGHANGPTLEEKRTARIILYGHSWGASATVMLARALHADGIPVLLTVQVDSVAKLGHNDAVIPENVEHAANFFQDNGFPRGQQNIRAADARRTQILGNFKFDYATKPVSCPEYPWIARAFMKPHIEIECDPVVWHTVEDLIRAELPPSAAASATAKNGSR
jgi:pimeloyl-ACP methyl ester carboxylesterase